MNVKLKVHAPPYNIKGKGHHVIGATKTTNAGMSGMAKQNKKKVVALDKVLSQFKQPNSWFQDDNYYFLSIISVYYPTWIVIHLTIRLLLSRSRPTEPG